MGWNKDPRYKAGGFWKCGVKHREKGRALYASGDHFYFRPDGGYIRRRRRQLAAQRAHVLDQLTQLDQEAKACAQS